MSDSRTVVVLLDPSEAEAFTCPVCQARVWSVMDRKCFLMVEDDREQTTPETRVLRVHRCAKPAKLPLTGEEAGRG